MKKALALTCAMTMAASLFLTGCGGSDYTTMSGNGSDNNSGSSNGSGKRVVNVCSWGEYIDEDLIYKFEDETGIKVNYQTAESNEALYSLLKTGAGDYDVIVPSDYMIARVWVPAPMGPFSSHAFTAKSIILPFSETAVISASAQTFIPTGVGASWETFRWVPTLPLPSSRYC